MKTGVSISLLSFVFVLIRPGICEGIEKVSYLLQYGPGVHTVFEQGNSPEKVTANVKDRVAPSTTPSTLTSKTTTNSSVEVSASTTTVLPQPTTVYHTLASVGSLQLLSDTAVTESVPHTTGNVTRAIVGMHSTEQNSDISSTIFTNALTPPHPLKLDITSEEKKRPTDAGSLAPDDRRRNSVSGACRTPVSVLQKLHPLPLPPPLPTFGAILRSDVMVNLKPKELRTLMSTYIGLIEAYKSFNQQQKRNIAHLEEELARHELITNRANRLRNTKVEILNK
ncbi:uncharacterized protein LOC128715388 [Anopheles marshallii]|uniref:uncharacterized protein LOC128715388 n=1 Tax=Anopheles marshallii TaxID=1521116 RepID=UPI00237B5000|nr:uncharacterized protein LOC128715388 [Anopheles marshallii]